MNRIEGGYGRVILGTFAHISTDVYRLRLSGDPTRLGVTSRHPFWSLDRGDWVPAADLLAGEHVATRTGWAVVESIVPDPGEHWVYNIQVEGDHRYLVGAAGVLVHNAGASFGNRVLGGYRWSANPQNLGEELMNAAIDYRVARPSLPAGRNLSVVRYNQGGQIKTTVFENTPSDPVLFPQGEHSEMKAWRLLQQDGVGVDDIIGWYTERSPCGRDCLPLFKRIRLPAEKVFWTSDYTIERGWFHNVIAEVVDRLRG